MDTIRGEAIAKCASLLGLAILNVNREELPEVLCDLWVPLRWTRNVFAGITRLDFDLLTERDISAINFHAGELLSDLTPLISMMSETAEVKYNPESIDALKTTCLIMLAELPPKVASMRVYAGII